MKRREFIKVVGIGTAACTIAPSVLAQELYPVRCSRCNKTAFYLLKDFDEGDVPIAGQIMSVDGRIFEAGELLCCSNCEVEGWVMKRKSGEFVWRNHPTLDWVHWPPLANTVPW